MPNVDMVRPDHGRAGHPTIIHGDGFQGQNVVVKFGSVMVPDGDVEILADPIIKVKVPPKAASDADTVDVKVSVGGADFGPFPFTYRD